MTFEHFKHRIAFSSFQGVGLLRPRHFLNITLPFTEYHRQMTNWRGATCVQNHDPIMLHTGRIIEITIIRE